jgi:hypothetical protein
MRHRLDQALLPEPSTTASRARERILEKRFFAHHETEAAPIPETDSPLKGDSRPHGFAQELFHFR